MVKEMFKYFIEYSRNITLAQQSSQKTSTEIKCLCVNFFLNQRDLFVHRIGTHCHGCINTFIHSNPLSKDE